VGDGPQRAEIEALVKELGCEEQVTLTGQLERSALSEMLSRADLCVHPSFTEGYCKAWLDAMAHGLPVLTTEVGAARAVVGGAGLRGWLVPPGNPVAFAATVRDVISHSVNWAPLRQRCRDFAADRTLERWAGAIGAACVEQWETPLNGRKQAS
jgi:glycosyltransferase involved in cell wall biosynthesis